MAPCKLPVSPEREQKKLKREKQNYEKKTYHMTCRVESGKREAVRAAGLAHHTPIDLPLSQREPRKVLLAVPLEREGPCFVSNPVTYPVVSPDVDEHAHPACQQCTDVVTELCKWSRAALNAIPTVGEQAENFSGTCGSTPSVARISGRSRNWEMSLRVEGYKY